MIHSYSKKCNDDETYFKCWLKLWLTEIFLHNCFILYWHRGCSMMYCKMEHVLFDMQDLLLTEKPKVTQLFLCIVKMQFLRFALIRTYDIKYSNVSYTVPVYSQNCTTYHNCIFVHEKLALAYFNDWHRVCIWKDLNNIISWCILRCTPRA